MLCVYPTKNDDNKASKEAKPIEVKHLKIKFEKSDWNWPDEVGLEDLQNAADLSDFHLVFPFDAWMRKACKDAMAAKIGQKLFVKCIKLFLLDHGLIEKTDRDKVYSEAKELLCQAILKEKIE